MTTVSIERGSGRSTTLLDARSARLALYAIFGLATFVLHFAFAGGYGYQRDELYFLVCAQHLAWGYVDQPPLIAAIAALSVFLFGDSLQAIRFLPAVAAAATVVLTGMLARRFAAGPYGIGMSMTAVVVSPFFLYVGTLLTMNAFEPLLWTAGAFLVLGIIDEERPVTARWFALAGIVALGILNKYTMLFYVAALLVSFAVLPQRRIFRGWVPLAAAAAGLFAIAPNVWWQFTHGWPQLEVLARATQFKNPALSPPAFFLQQILMLNPATAPIWIAGLVALVGMREGRYRVFAVAYGLLLVTFALLHGKIYYLASIYPLLLAAGGAPVEKSLRSMPLRWGYAGVLVFVGAIIAPQVLPVLPLDRFVSYQRMLDFRLIREEQHAAGRIPQQFADMLGWDTFVGTVAASYAHVPSNERSDTAILTRNYGMAGAIDILGDRYGLPRAISGHNNYFLWGPRKYTGRHVLAVGLSEAILREEFAEVEQVATFRDPWVLPDENNVRIFLCSKPLQPLAEFWPRVKAYI